MGERALPAMPWPLLIGVLVGFPALFFLWSLPLLHRQAFTIPGLDFFTGYWLATAGIYAGKIWLVLLLLRRHGWGAADIGLPVGRQRIGRIVLLYVLFAGLAFLAVEAMAARTVFDAERLARLPGLYPRNSEQRLALLFLALFAGVSEEITYRGFAISGLVSRGVSRWLAVGIAALPFVLQHGLKSLDQFWWFLLNGLLLGLIYVTSRRLLPGILLHWGIIWVALLGVFQAAAVS